MASSNSDWLDQELDRLAQGSYPDRQPPDPGLANTAQEINQMYANEQSHQPDDNFVRRLGETLMPAAPIASGIPLAQTKPASGTFWSDHGINLPKTRSRPRMTFVTSILSVAALLILLAGSAYVALRNTSPGSPTTPTMAGMAAATSDNVATPAPTSSLNWSMPLAEGGSLDYGGMAVANGMVYRLIATQKFVGLEAVDSVQGVILFRQSTDWSAGGIAADDSGVYFLSGPDASGQSNLVVLNPADGSAKWTAELNDTPLAFSLIDGTVYLWDNADTMQAFDAATGTLKWHSNSLKPANADPNQVQAFMFDASPVAVANDVVMISTTGSLVALDAEGGDLHWTHDGFSPAFTRFITANDQLFTLSWTDGTQERATPMQLAEVNVTDGTIVWESELIGQPITPGTHITLNANSMPAEKRAEETIYNELIVSADAVVLSGETSTPEATAQPAISPTSSVVFGIDVNEGTVTWSRVIEQGIVTGFFNAREDAPLMIIDDGHLLGGGPDVADDAFFQASVYLEQPIIGQLANDDQGIYATLQDGTLVSISPDVFVLRG